MANRAAGKGYENEDNYSNIKFQFIGIENIHVMRSSLQKMLEGKPFPDAQYLKHAAKCFNVKRNKSIFSLKIVFFTVWLLHSVFTVVGGESWEDHIAANFVPFSRVFCKHHGGGSLPRG